jgi:hypothetical protein
VTEKPDHQPRRLLSDLTDHGVKEEAREILEEIVREMELAADPVIIHRHGPTQFGHRPRPDDAERYETARARALTMLRSREVIREFRWTHDGFQIVADEEVVRAALAHSIVRPRRPRLSQFLRRKLR